MNIAYRSRSRAHAHACTALVNTACVRAAGYTRFRLPADATLVAGIAQKFKQLRIVDSRAIHERQNHTAAYTANSFAAFNQIVQESGLDLADYKGKTVEKWTVLCPQLSTDDHDTYCVLLVYKAKAVGAYLLQKPSGEVTGLITAAKAGAEAASEEETVEISADAYPEE